MRSTLEVADYYLPEISITRKIQACNNIEAYVLDLRVIFSVYPWKEIHVGELIIVLGCGGVILPCSPTAASSSGHRGPLQGRGGG